MSRLSPVYIEMGSPREVRKPWTLYRDAGVMMEIADFAERNARDLDHVLIAELRNDALRIRIGALKAFLMRRP